MRRVVSWAISFRFQDVYKWKRMAGVGKAGGIRIGLRAMEAKQSLSEIKQEMAKTSDLLS